jgi:hypothetical protein
MDDTIQLSHDSLADDLNRNAVEKFEALNSRQPISSSHT